MRSRKNTLVFVINSLATGGAERALVNLITYMEAELRTLDVHLVLLDREEECHDVPHWVRKHVLDARGGLLRSIFLLRRLMKRLAPDLTISFLSRANCAGIISSRLLGCPCIISERVHTSSHFQDGVAAWINRRIVRLVYPLADEIIAVSQGVRNNLVNEFAVSESKVRVVHNPIDLESIDIRASEPHGLDLPASYIVGVGRLVPNKNFPLLVRAYQLAAIDHPLVILGEGPCRDELTRLINASGLSNRILLPGYIPNPYPIIRGAEYLVSSSNAEGFPNAIVEAMALGCPVIATDCESGPREILAATDAPPCRELMFAKYGVLVPTNSVEALASAIRLFDTNERRAMYAERGRERASDFGVQKSVAKYLEAIAAYIS